MAPVSGEEPGEITLKRLNEGSLKMGDIILTTTTAAVSKAIRAATRSDISHAMVYVEDRSVIDATAEGVQARNTQRLFFENECSIYALRLQNDLTDTQLTTVRNFLRGRIGTQYSTGEAIQTALGGARQWSKKQFCSRLVAQAFATAGIKLVDDPNFCSPANLKDSPLLVEVNDATVPVTAEEAALWEGLEDTPQMMRNAINAVLGGARAKNKHIQTFDDLHRHLVKHPEDDDYICHLLETSGYLSVWRIEKEKNPWQYDLNLMLAAPAAEIKDYCWSVLANEDGGPNRYVVNRKGYVQFSRRFKLRFFRIMADLYTLLSNLHRTRVEVATKWLQANQRLVPATNLYLRPHTPEWFAAMEVWDPPRAAMTRKMIELAGSPDVCSICGDEPAHDYRLEEADRPAGGVATLRLCADCLEIRQRSGEPYVLLANEGERVEGDAS